MTDRNLRAPGHSTSLLSSWVTLHRSIELIRRAFVEFLLIPTLVIGGFLLLAGVAAVTVVLSYAGLKLVEAARFGPVLAFKSASDDLLFSAAAYGAVPGPYGFFAPQAEWIVVCEPPDNMMPMYEEALKQRYEKLMATISQQMRDRSGLIYNRIRRRGGKYPVIYLPPRFAEDIFEIALFDSQEQQSCWAAGRQQSRYGAVQIATGTVSL